MFYKRHCEAIQELEMELHKLLTESHAKLSKIEMGTTYDIIDAHGKTPLDEYYKKKQRDVANLLFASTMEQRRALIAGMLPIDAYLVQILAVLVLRQSWKLLKGLDLLRLDEIDNPGDAALRLYEVMRTASAAVEIPVQF